MRKMIRHYIGRLIDILVIPLVPKKYKLMAQYQKHSILLGWEPETRRIKDYARAGTLAIDIGGNMGLWTYAMVKSSMFKEVLVFEPNSALTSDLANAGLDNVKIIHKAVSSVTGSSCLRIPVHGEMLLNGWASLEANIDVDTDIFEELNVETIRLDDLALEDVGFIKIDVEGHELDLLAGAREFFFVNRPVCIIECREKNKQQVKDYFSGLGVGYNFIDTTALYGYALSPGNILFSTP